MVKKIYAKGVLKVLLYDANEMLEKGTNSKVIQKAIIRRLQRLDNASSFTIWD